MGFRAWANWDLGGEVGGCDFVPDQAELPFAPRPEGTAPALEELSEGLVLEGRIATVLAKPSWGST